MGILLNPQTWIFLLVLFSLPCLMFLFFYSRRYNRRNKLKKFAIKSGLTFAPKPVIGTLPSFEPFYFFQNKKDPKSFEIENKTIENVIRGEYKSKELFVFDFRYGIWTFPYRSRGAGIPLYLERIVTLALFESGHDIPSFLIQPRMFLPENFDPPQGYREIGRLEDSKFLKNYCAFSTQEDAFLRLFNPGVQDLFQIPAEWFIEGVGPCLIFHKDRSLDASEIPFFFNSANRLADALLA